MVAALVRTDGGRVVHRTSCHYVTRSGDASRAVPWAWAAGRPIREVKAAIAMVSSRECRSCKPMLTADVA